MTDQPTFIKNFDSVFSKICDDLIKVNNSNLMYDVVTELSKKSQKPHLIVSLVDFYNMNEEDQKEYKDYYFEFMEEKYFNLIFSKGKSVADTLYKILQFDTERSAAEFIHDYFPQRQDFRLSKKPCRWIPVEMVGKNGSLTFSNYCK